MPVGADAVVMVEETERGDGHDVRIFTPVYPQQHVGRRAADIAAGSAVLQPGDVLTPSRIGALAAIGASDVEVFAQPRLAILSTGNEIVEPGKPLAPGQIYDINRFTLAAIVETHGGVAVPLPSVPDTIDALSAAVDSALAEDVLVFSGGSSVGERDLILDVIAARGEVIFHGVAVKPGKPTVFGRIGATPVIGMPGYPTSCLSNGYMLLVPMLRRMARLPEHQPRTVDRAASAAHRLDDGAAPVLHGSAGGRVGGARVQGVGRHHQHGARRRLHRNPRARRHRRRRPAGRGKTVLTRSSCERLR